VTFEKNFHVTSNFFVTKSAVLSLQFASFIFKNSFFSSTLPLDCIEDSPSFPMDDIYEPSQNWQKTLERTVPAVVAIKFCTVRAFDTERYCNILAANIAEK
jgi:hypothetical protein